MRVLVVHSRTVDLPDWDGTRKQLHGSGSAGSVSSEVLKSRTVGLGSTHSVTPNCTCAYMSRYFTIEISIIGLEGPCFHISFFPWHTRELTHSEFCFSICRIPQ